MLRLNRGEEARLLAEAQRQLERPGAAYACAGGEPGTGPAAHVGDCARAVLRPNPVAARRARQPACAKEKQALAALLSAAQRGHERASSWNMTWTL